MGIRSEYVPVYHESCINHELRQVCTIAEESNTPHHEIHLKCLKGHNLFETNPKHCKDYDMTVEPFGWKLSLMNQLIKDLMQGD